MNYLNYFFKKSMFCSNEDLEDRYINPDFNNLSILLDEFDEIEPNLPNQFESSTEDRTFSQIKIKDNRFQDTNTRRKIKHILLFSILKFINDRIKKFL